MIIIIKTAKIYLVWAHVIKDAKEYCGFACSLFFLIKRYT